MKVPAINWRNIPLTLIQPLWLSAGKNELLALTGG